MTTIVTSLPIVLGPSAGSSATALAECTGGSVIVGGGGSLAGFNQEGIAITRAFPKQEPVGYEVTFYRFTDALEPGEETQIVAYAICASISTPG